MTDSESFFDVLKNKRESQNIEISEICEFTRIHSKYIEAIEKGDFTVLPNVYIRLFLKSYANFIGADSAKALKDYELHTTGKIIQSEALTNNKTEDTPSSKLPIEELTDANPQISPKQIASGIGVICAIFLLLWWASMVTQEQAENIESNGPNMGIGSESNLLQQSIKSNPDLEINTATDTLLDKPLLP